MSDDRVELLVVGGGPAGFAAVNGYRDAGGGGSVAMIAAEQQLPYERPSLSKELLRGEISESEVWLAPESWTAARAVRFVSDLAVALDPANHRVKLAGGRELSYSTCVIATGAEPTRIPVPGADDPGVRVLRSLEQLRELKARLSDRAAVVVIGSGFIGCEVAASLRAGGHPVELISGERLPNEGRLGPEPAARVRDWLREVAVTLHLDCEVERITRTEPGYEVSGTGASAKGRLVVMATGVTPRSELAAVAGARMSEDRAICVDSAMWSSLDGVLAAGDVACAENSTAGRALRVEHWGDALVQGELAGRSAAGDQCSWGEVPGFWSSIGARTLKYAAWGDGFEAIDFESHSGGGFTAWYRSGGELVGVLTHHADADYERGRDLIAEGARTGGGAPGSST